MKTFDLGIPDECATIVNTSVVSLIEKIENGRVSPSDVVLHINSILDNIADIDVNVVDETVVERILKNINPVIIKYGSEALNAVTVRDNWMNKSSSSEKELNYVNLRNEVSIALVQWHNALRNIGTDGLDVFVCDMDKINMRELSKNSLYLFSDIGALSQVSQIDGIIVDGRGQTINLNSVITYESDNAIKDTMSKFLNFSGNILDKIIGLCSVNSRLNTISFHLKSLNKDVVFNIDPEKGIVVSNAKTINKKQLAEQIKRRREETNAEKQITTGFTI